MLPQKKLEKTSEEEEYLSCNSCIEEDDSEEDEAEEPVEAA
jgi:hypothetical protein